MVERPPDYADLLARLRVVAGVGGQVVARAEEPAPPRSSGGEPIAPPPGAGSRPDVVVAYFATSDAEHQRAVRADLDPAAEWLTANGRGRVIVEGHADQRGVAYLSEALATQRADAIRAHFVTRGVDGEVVDVRAANPLRLPGNHPGSRFVGRRHSMSLATLEATARALVAAGTGILAADESHAT